MATDDERRYVARKLRLGGRPSLMKLMAYTQAGGDELFDRLADLIEPAPERTCRMGAPVDGEYRCSVCGHIQRETCSPYKGWYEPRYCAHCGARVVRDDG